MTWMLYILRCGDDSLYTGVTNDMARRLSMHENGTGAKYTRGRGPLVLVYSESHGSRADAQKRERAVKSMNKAAKLALCAGWSRDQT